MHLTRPVRLLLLPALWTAAAFHLAAADSGFPAGKSKIETSIAGKTLEVFTYRPTNYTDGPLIVVFHGMLRNADTYRDNAVALGDRFNALIAAPLFDANRFPNEAYQRGGITKKGTVQPKEEWTYSLVSPLVESLRQHAGRPDMPYYLIGHSAGGQFLVRMAAFVPTGAKRIVAANAGAHIFPTREADFPYGFGGLPDELGGDAALKRFLAQPLTLYQGTADVLEENLDKSAAAMKQGPTRIERGRANFNLGQEVAQKLRCEFNWSLVEAPGIGHDSKLMFEHANVEMALLTAKCLTEGASRKQLLLKAAEGAAKTK
jgi:poly(3-hydroxybutyrate) depolymerase